MGSTRRPATFTDMATGLAVDVTVGAGDLATIPDSGGLRLVQFADDDRQVICFGDVVMPMPEGTMTVACRDIMKPETGKLIGKWWPDRETAKRDLLPYRITPVRQVPAVPAGEK